MLGIDTPDLTPDQLVLKVGFPCLKAQDGGASDLEVSQSAIVVEERPLFRRFSHISDAIVHMGVYGDRVTVSSLLSQTMKPDVKAYRAMPATLKEAIVSVSKAQIATEEKRDLFVAKLDESLENLPKVRERLLVGRGSLGRSSQGGGNTTRLTYFLEDYLLLLADRRIERIRDIVLDSFMDRSCPDVQLVFPTPSSETTFWKILAPMVQFSLGQLGSAWKPEFVEERINNLRKTGLLVTVVAPEYIAPLNGSYLFQHSERGVEAVDLRTASVVSSISVKLMDVLEAFELRPGQPTARTLRGDLLRSTVGKRR